MLSQQYYIVLSQPRPDKIVTDSDVFFTGNVEGSKP